MQADENSSRQVSSGSLFSPREVAVLVAIADGLSDKEIAGQLGLSTLTVGRHVASILGKLGAASRTEAAVRAIKDGVIP